ncbi:MAG: asparagine synthase (glutamine-hydrolyzing), partial [Gammaproteobacteria bacterium]|nr:asparagine synthase (glutamine-hydrolyzing) [Gammaproteobacteria bacterium]
MCGIAGLICADRKRLETVVSRMTAALSHRGPDEQGCLIERSFALAHTRLSIIDLQTGTQPLYAEQGRYALIANGEVYNHVELREELRQSGCEFASGSDSETIVQLFAKHGPAAFDRLRGMYAAAIFDRQQQRLTLVRDRLGIKPLFYIQSEGLFGFASEIKALLPLLPTEPEFDAAALRAALEQNYSTGRQTPFARIQRLLPGEWMEVDGSGIRRQIRYWQPLPVAEVPRSFDAAVQALDELMTDSVREHLRSDVPVGIFLSGGLDSSSLLSLMRDEVEAPIDAYTVGFSDGKDELSLAAHTAKALGAHHHPLKLGRQELIDWLPLAVWSADELMFDYANLPTLRLAAEAARQLKVVITGEGGDEVFAGYGRYRPNRLRNLFGRRRARRKGNFHPY